MRGLWAQLRLELALTFRNAESLLLTLGIPVVILVFFSVVDVLPIDGDDVGQAGFALGRELIRHAAIVAPPVRARYSEERKSSSAALTSSVRSCWVQ